MIKIIFSLIIFEFLNIGGFYVFKHFSKKALQKELEKYKPEDTSNDWIHYFDPADFK